MVTFLLRLSSTVQIGLNSAMLNSAVFFSRNYSSEPNSVGHVKPWALVTSYSSFTVSSSVILAVKRLTPSCLRLAVLVVFLSEL